jgi:hypothetical protein
MKVMSTKTKKPAVEVIQKAKEFFNGRFGLDIRNESSDCCIEFANDLGFVTVEVTKEDKGSQVTLTTREWEYQVQEFLGLLK